MSRTGIHTPNNKCVYLLNYITAKHLGIKVNPLGKCLCKYLFDGNYSSFISDVCMCVPTCGVRMCQRANYVLCKSWLVLLCVIIGRSIYRTVRQWGGVSVGGGVHDNYTFPVQTGGIIDFPWHCHQIEGTDGI